MHAIWPRRSWWMTAAVVAILSGSTPRAMAGDAPSVKPPASGRSETTLDLGGDVAMRLALVPAGQFMMGSPASEKTRFALDETLHEVIFSKPFYLGATHVTVDQFAAFVKKTGYTTDAEREGGGPTWRNPGIPQEGNHPVVCVSYNDAKAFCDWLGKVHAKNCHLPTEAQWEYACRAGRSAAYCWGDNPADGKPWAHWNAPKAGTLPAGSLKPNRWGLYDMHGNALAWCSDCYGPYVKGPATDPAGPTAAFPYDASEGRTHVLRGGAWHLPPANCRSAYRHWGAVDHRFSSLGFRVCVDAM
jgi:formylglycine-generating enzyme required for sulfatase activity